MDKTGADQSGAPRVRRFGYCFIQVSTLLILIGLSHMARHSEQVFIQLEMRSLPGITGMILGLASFVRSPAGAAIIAIGGLTLIVLALRGTLDPVLKKLIVLNLIGAALFIPVFYLSLQLPLRQIRAQLESR